MKKHHTILPVVLRGVADEQMLGCGIVLRSQLLPSIVLISIPVQRSFYMK